MDRLTENEADWGLTREQFAAREKWFARQRAKARREKFRLLHTAVTVVPEVEPELPLEVYRSGSGFLAYRVRRLGEIISLPFVSILEA